MALRTASWGGPWSWSSSEDEAVSLWAQLRWWVRREKWKSRALAIPQPQLKLGIEDFILWETMDGKEFVGKGRGHGSVKKTVVLNTAALHAISDPFDSFSDLSSAVYMEIMPTKLLSVGQKSENEFIGYKRWPWMVVCGLEKPHNQWATKLG